MHTGASPTGTAAKTGSSISFRQTLNSLQYANFRYLWIGQLGSSGALWMEAVARGWLIYQMTDSPFMLGLVNATRAVPMLFFGVIGGVVADRFDRRKLLIFAQLSNMILNIILAVLIVTGRVEVWHVLVTAFLAGIVMSFQQPARMALLPNLVPKTDLMNAVALNSAAMQITRSIGPAIAGFLVGTVGMGGAYFAQAGLLLWAAMLTTPIKVEDTSAHARQSSALTNLKEGLSYVKSNEIVLTLLIVALIPMLLGMPYASLMPVFARDILNIGPEGLGILMSAPGIGALIGATTVASLRNFNRRGLVLLLGAVAFGLTLIFFALSTWLLPSLIFLAIIGFANTSYMAMNNVLLQIHTPDSLRGRVMSIFLLDQGLMPLGTLFVATLATAIGAPISLAAMGAACCLLAIGVMVFKPNIRKLA